MIGPCAICRRWCPWRISVKTASHPRCVRRRQLVQALLHFYFFISHWSLISLKCIQPRVCYDFGGGGGGDIGRDVSDGVGGLEPPRDSPGPLQLLGVCGVCGTGLGGG